MTNFKKSLLFRLTVLYAATFTLLAAVGFGVIYYRLFSITIEKIDWELRQEIQMFARLLEGEGLAAVRSKILEEVNAEDAGEEFHSVIDTNAEILVATDMTAWAEVNRRHAATRLIRRDVEYTAETIELRDGGKARVVSAFIGQAFIMQIGETLEEADEYLEIFRTLLTFLIISMVAISAAIGWGLARRSLTGMAAVTLAAEDITNGDYSRRVEVAGHFREVERLGAAFNTMVDRIQNLLQSMQQINDNIAHDLRSPLARIRGIAEMVIVKNKDIDDFREMAVSTIEECDTLIAMINTMLDITEIEAGVNEAQQEQFDLTRLVSQACDLFAPIAASKRIHLESKLPAGLVFNGDRKRMQRVVTNLLENAIKYTPGGGSVIVSAVRENGILKLDFKDTGDGIAENDLPHIFQRFYRCDRSRSKKGVGLGLSLVKAYTESMKGAIFVKSVPNRGSVFTLQFSC